MTNQALFDRVAHHLLTQARGWRGRSLALVEFLAVTRTTVPSRRKHTSYDKPLLPQPHTFLT